MPRTMSLMTASASTSIGIAGLAARYAAGVARADRPWPIEVATKLRDLGEVDEVSILPLVERL